ncbi:hypothetical protein [Streptomyces sp. MUM 178J]|uniref:hypothetical protein n=1 Tax=Streptomyces sp. MUM 178J TaxID=2791991 RepID=UPI001F044FC7|nr:hypothetical protein [Streptomyces sp. MUM 178J]WRQ83114.1 hypothetical protein I3F59_029355 [Streptomyces sp. MUM 178J]
MSVSGSGSGSGPDPGSAFVSGESVGAQGARSRALAVLRVRSRALAVALLPAAAAVVLLAGGPTGHMTGPGWDAARWGVSGFAAVVLLVAAAVAAVIARATPALTPTVDLPERAAPDLYRLVRDLADRLDVPAPSALAVTPDCDSWLEDRSHPSHAMRGRRRGGTGEAPVLVIGSPFLWWMRVAELRAVLAPVVAGTGPSAHPDIAAARRFVRGLDAAVGDAARVGDPAGQQGFGRPGGGQGDLPPRLIRHRLIRHLLVQPIRAISLRCVGWTARVMLRSCREHAAEMERGVAAAASERAQAVDYGLRIVAQEQVGLAYAGWDRLLTRVALPAWRMGRWPSRLDAGVVSALTELSRRDRLAEGFASRLGERPACDLLEEPGAVDEAASLLAARLFHGGPAETGPDWSPVDWQQYPEEVVDRKWRTEAARLHRVLDEMGVPRSGGPEGPTLARVIGHLSAPPTTPQQQVSEASSASAASAAASRVASTADASGEASEAFSASPGPGVHDGAHDGAGERSEALAAGITAEVAREEAARDAAARRKAAALGAPGAPPGPGGASGPPGAAHPPVPAGGSAGDSLALWDAEPLPLFPLQPPRSGRELLADHVTAMVCCAAVDTAGAVPGLDWLDGPALLVGGERTADLSSTVLSLVEDGDAQPLRVWLGSLGIRPEKPVRLV